MMFVRYGILPGTPRLWKKRSRLKRQRGGRLGRKTEQFTPDQMKVKIVTYLCETHGNFPRFLDSSRQA